MYHTRVFHTHSHTRPLHSSLGLGWFVTHLSLSLSLSFSLGLHRNTSLSTNFPRPGGPFSVCVRKAVREKRGGGKGVSWCGGEKRVSWWSGGGGLEVSLDFRDGGVTSLAQFRGHGHALENKRKRKGLSFQALGPLDTFRRRLVFLSFIRFDNPGQVQGRESAISSCVNLYVT